MIGSLLPIEEHHKGKKGKSIRDVFIQQDRDHELHFSGFFFKIVKQPLYYLYLGPIDYD
jgi:hypothetical protein